MGKQINYWLGYESFLIIAQTALDCGCVIIKPTSEGLLYGQTLEIVTEQENRYFFYVPEAGKLSGETIPFENNAVDGYTASGNTVIQAGFSIKNDARKEIYRSRIFAISGYYNSNGDFAARPECVTKIYNRLVRVVKKVAPYTELSDTYFSIDSSKYLQETEWKHKEYISPQFLQLKILENYRLR